MVVLVVVGTVPSKNHHLIPRHYQGHVNKLCKVKQVSWLSSLFLSYYDCCCDPPVVNGGGNWSTQLNPPPYPKSLAAFSHAPALSQDIVFSTDMNGLNIADPLLLTLLLLVANLDRMK